ncbi:hypothetical protein PIROE2DRAFT_14099 [Piromyces sp. E2]|nr:hypothetical protein PIROE2DRAFT_14099 [Piromyces sp. E2]|eukprot:OUM60204.1 hypothetical protein PIROE2DRAFT_14099 [Piromyces sp. E2]
MIAPSQFMSLAVTLDPVYPRNINSNIRSPTSLGSPINRYSSLSPSSIGFNYVISHMQSPNGIRNRLYPC